MSHAVWIGGLAAILILLIFALRPHLMRLAERIHRWRTSRHKENNT